MYFTETPFFLALSPIERAVALNCQHWMAQILHTARRIAEALDDGTLSEDATTEAEVFAVFPDWEDDPMWSETEIALHSIREIDGFEVYELDKSFGQRQTWTFYENDFKEAGITCDAFWEAVHPLTIQARAALFVRATSPSSPA
jgi:hypothetical protein